jgi:3,4-dihydroxy 2-butanone 4-phosphate synthase/GTP cyclohydrolase II
MDITPVKLKEAYQLNERTVLGIDTDHYHHDHVLHEVATRLPTKDGKFRIHLFKDGEKREHIALVKGEVRGKEDVLTRVHSECLTGDLFGSLRCDCGPQLHHAMRIIEESERGILIYLRQEGRGIGLAEKLKTYNLQDAGLDTVDANIYLGHKAEERDYHVASEILNDLGVNSIILISNNPDKEMKLKRLGIDVRDRMELEPDVSIENLRYLKTKIDRMGHELGSTQLFPFQPEMDDVRRYVVRRRDSKKGIPYISVFNISGLDGQLTYEPRLPGKNPALYRILRKKLMREHDALLVTSDDLDLALQARESNMKILIFDPDLRVRMDHPILADEGQDVIILRGPVSSGKVDELDERSIPHHPILDHDHDLDIGAFMDVMKMDSITSIMVDGKDGISDLLMRSGLVDTVMNTLVPVISGGKGTKHYSLEFELRDIGNVRMGEEVVYYGTPEFKLD